MWVTPVLVGWRQENWGFKDILDSMTPCLQNTKQNLFNWIWWQMPVMSTLGRLRHENGEFKVSLAGTIALSRAPAERLGKR